MSFYNLPRGFMFADYIKADLEVSKKYPSTTELIDSLYAQNTKRDEIWSWIKVHWCGLSAIGIIVGYLSLLYGYYLKFHRRTGGGAL